MARLTIREPRLIVQLLDNMNLAAANGLSLDAAWARVAAGLGVRADDPAIRDGHRITTNVRERCITAGVLPFDLQIEAACWLLAQSEVLERQARRYRLLVVDGLDEFVPAVIRAVGRLAGVIPEAALGFSTDGGLRWMLGASGVAAERECRGLIASGGFRGVRLAGSDPAGKRAVAARITRALTLDTDDSTAPPPRGWSLHESQRPDQMARAAVVEVLVLLDEGVPPEEIVLLTPYLDPIVASELVRAFGDQDVPFRVEHRWRSLFDDPATRACLTALRLAAPAPQRPASLVELADLLATLLLTNPVSAQRLANVMYDQQEGTLRPLAGIQRRMADARFDPLPEAARPAGTLGRKRAA